MRGRLYVVVSLLIATASATTAFAANDDTQMTVTVNALDILTVPTSSGITLSSNTQGNYDEKTNISTDGLEYSHNSVTDKRITAVAIADGGNAGNDIDLDVTVEGGAGKQHLVIDGADQPAQTVRDNMPAGYYQLDVTWQGKGSLASTKAGSYVWTVTFTSQDAS
jgi:hypothetical protein